MHKNSEKFIAYEYPFDDKDIDIAYIEINGRYPEKGFAMNENVKQIVLVIDGQGKIVIDKKEYPIEEGDAVLILPNQKYFFEDNFKLAVSCNPAWNPAQNKTLE